MCPYLYYLMCCQSYNPYNEYIDSSFRGPNPMSPPFPPQFGPGGPPPQQFPQGGGQSSQPPPGRPPSNIPKKPKNMTGFAVDQGSIRFCRFKYTYIWLRNGIGFWMYIIYVGPQSIFGWRWTGSRWVNFGIDLRRIDSFVCF